MRSMSWRRPRRSWRHPSEYSPLELDRSSYATFRSFPSKHHKDKASLWRSHPYWTLTSVLVGVFLVYKSIMRHPASPEQQLYYRHNTDTSPAMSSWDHNHYVSEEQQQEEHERNLLIAQMAPFRPFSDITSRPNRAYARRWGWDFMLHSGGSDEACNTVKMLNHILTKQQHKSDDRAPYDAILFLSQDAVIMDMDYQLLALLPNDKIVASGETSNEADLFLWNVRHKHSHDVARLWLDLADDSNCDLVSLYSAIEMTAADKHFDVSNYIQPLQVSDGGFVEPRLIKFLPSQEEQQSNFAETLAELQTVVDSVCYRYYPRCEVL